MILVDDVVFSKEAWEWFSSRRSSLTNLMSGHDNIAPFMRPYINDNIRNGVSRKDEYQELSCAETWYLFHNMFMLLSDILKDFPPLSTSTTTTELKEGLLVLESFMVYWSLSKGFKESEFAGMQKEFVGADRDSTNMSFCMNVYCMMNAIWERYDVLEEILHGREVPDMPPRRINTNGTIDFTVVNNEYSCNEFLGRNETGVEFMKFVIRKCCAGDFDDFVISVKTAIADSTIGKYHVELAKMRGYEMMGMSDFSDMPKQEAWRRLFTTYFDKEETRFDLFYMEYMRPCVWFVLMSFMSIENGGNIWYIPVYNIYSNNDFRESYEQSITKMIDTKIIRYKLKKLYNLAVPIK